MKKAVQGFVVIVLGVLTALLGEGLVDGWQDSVTADAYRAGVAADLRQDIEAASNAVYFRARVIDSGRRVTEWLAGDDTSLATNAILVHAVNAAQVDPFSVTRDAWDDLTGTGQLALLDEGERMALASYFRRDEDRAGLGDTPSAYREAVLRLVPAGLLVRVLEGCVYPDGGVRRAPLRTDVADFSERLLESFDSLPSCDAVSDGEAEPVITSLRRAPGIAGDLNLRTYGVVVEAIFLQQMHRRAIEALREIDGVP